MSAPQSSSADSTLETPASSGTGGQNLYPSDSVPAAEVSNQESKVGQIDVKQDGAEREAEQRYEERIEEEYAKREGGA